MNIKKILTIMLSILLCNGIFINQSFASETNNIKELESPESYINYLSKQRNSLSDEALDQFKNLNEEEQKVFLEALKPENFFEIVDNAFENEGEEISLKINNSDITAKIIYDENIEKESRVRQSAKGTLVLYLFNLKVSEYSSTVVYEYSNSKVTKVYDCYGTHRNINPAVWTEDMGSSSPYISSGYGYGRSSWRLRATGTLGFISETVHVTVRTNGKVKQYKSDSSRPGWTTNWRNA